MLARDDGFIGSCLEATPESFLGTTIQFQIKLELSN